MNWLVWRIPFLRRRREREIRGWAEYAVAMLEVHIASLPEHLKQDVREAYRRQATGTRT